MASIEKAQESLPSLREGQIASKSWDEHLVEKIPPLKNVIGEHIGRQFTPADPALVVGTYSPDFISESKQVSIVLHSEDLDHARGYRVEVVDNSKSKVRLVEKLDSKVFNRELKNSFDRLPEIVATSTATI